MGILMERYQITSDLAFDVLVDAGKETGCGLGDAAHALLETGCCPVRTDTEIANY
jgi:hypothetical protein